MKRVQQGFTLIELMIVVAIIGILAAIAIPQYAEYTNRARVSEGLQLAAGAKTALAEYYSSQNDYPASNVMAGLAAPTDIQGNNVSSVTLAGANITIVYKGLSTDICGAGTDVQLVADCVTKPGSCQYSGNGAGTTIAQRCRPANLR